MKTRNTLLGIIGAVLLSILAVILYQRATNKKLFNDKKNELEVGETASILVYETPSTGFLWHCEIADDSILMIESEEYRKRNPFNNLPGGDAREHRIKFKALKPGETVITLTEKRGQEEIEEIREYIVVVIAD